MDAVDRRRQTRVQIQIQIQAIEGLEGRCLMATALPDIAMVAATTSDSRGVTFDYDINDAAVNQPIHFEVYRSPDSSINSGAQAVGGVVVNPTGPGGPTLDQAGNPGTASGHHQITVTLPGGLPPSPDRPFVVVAADPENSVHESNEANNTASFRKYVIGIITHGGVQPKSWKAGPPWEHRMARSLEADGYDAVIPFNWVAASNHAGSAVRQAPRLDRMILNVANQFPAGAPVDVHFIGHSEGAVINSQAVLRLNQADAWTPGMKAGYLKMTMLDPHAANNGLPMQQYSVSSGLLGSYARAEINAYQSKAKDPVVVVPSNVQDAEVFYQHTPVAKSGGSNHGIYNLWGQVPVHGDASYFNLTAPGISHSGKFGVQDWYEANVVPTLGDGAPFVRADTLTGVEVSETAEGGRSSALQRVEYDGTAGPGARVELFAARPGDSALTPVGHAVAGADGTWDTTTQPLAPGRYRVVATADAPSGPRRGPATMKPIAWLAPLTLKPR